MLLKECKALQNISLHENPISMEQFQQARSFNPLKSMISFFLKFIFLFLSSCFYFPSAHTFFFPLSLQTEGFQEFEARRKRKFDKVIDSNVMINSRGLDEGIDF